MYTAICFEAWIDDKGQGSTSVVEKGASEFLDDDPITPLRSLVGEPPKFVRCQLNRYQGTLLCTLPYCRMAPNRARNL